MVGVMPIAAGGHRVVIPGGDEAEGERRLVNLRRLLTGFEQAGHGLNLDLLGLLDWIRQRGDQRDPGDPDQQPADMGSAKVKIMTIHASKGLEFPIVFLAGGFTQRQLGGSFASYRDDQGRNVFDLLGDNEGKSVSRSNGTPSSAACCMSP